MDAVEPVDPWSPGGAWPFVGRVTERAAVERALRGAGAGSLLVRGPAGSGATRVLAEAAATVGAEGHRVLRVNAMPSTRDVAFGALGAAVPTLAAMPGADRAERTATAVLALGSGAWSAVVVDDLADLDDATASVLHHVVAGGRLTLVGAVHDGDPLPEPISALRIADLVEVVNLPPFSAGEVGRLVEQACGGQLDAGSTRRLTVASSGNPLLVVEIVRAAVVDGSLLQEHGVWHWNPAIATPTRLVGLVDRQLVGLSPAGRRACALVALVDAVTLDEVRELAIGDGVAEAERAGLVAIDGDTTVRIAHPVHTRAITALVEPPTALAGQLADLRRSVASEDPFRVLALVRLVRTTGVVHRVDDLIDGAWAALQIGDAPQAIELGRHAAAMDRSVESLRPLAEALQHGSLADVDDAVALYAELASTALTDDDLATALVGRHQALVVRAQLGGIDVGLDAARAQLFERSTASVTPRARQRIDVELVRAHWLRSELEAAAAVAESLVEGPGTDPLVRLEALDALAPVEVGLGRSDRLQDLCDATAPTLVESTHRDRTAAPTHLLVRAQAAVGRGDLASGRHLLAQVASARRDRDHDRLELTCLALTAAIDLERGDAAAARRGLRDVASHFGDPDARSVSGLDLARLVEASARLGLEDEARAVGERLVVAATDYGFGISVAHLALARMWTTIVAEPSDRSRWAHAADAATVACGRTEHLDLTLRAAHQAWLIEPTDARATRLAAVARRVEGPWAEAVRRHVDAVRGGDGVVLMDLASRLLALGRVLDAAVVADSAAHAHLAADESRAALLAAHFADEQLARCGHPAVFHRRPAIVAPALSPREHEIAEYAAEGWSNREIASRVHLSVRTVEGHVLNACTKLGVRDRSELALLLAGARDGRA